MAFELAEPNLHENASESGLAWKWTYVTRAQVMWRWGMGVRMTLLCPEWPSSIPRRYARQLGSWCPQVSEAAKVKQTGFR